MVTLDDTLVDHIIIKIEQDNLVSQLLYLCDENLITEIKEIGCNIALDVASKLQGTNPYDLSMQITADQENDSLLPNSEAAQEANARHNTTLRICDRIASAEVAMKVMEDLKNKYREPQ